MRRKLHTCEARGERSRSSFLRRWVAKQLAGAQQLCMKFGCVEGSAELSAESFQDNAAAVNLFVCEIFV